MAGYNYRENKSNNAVQAEQDGILMRKDAERFLVEKFSITKKEAGFILDWTMTSEWHHVGSRYKRVRYYDLSDAGREGFLSQRREEAKEAYELEVVRARGIFDHPYIEKGETTFCEFLKIWMKLRNNLERNPSKQRPQIFGFFI